MITYFYLDFIDMNAAKFYLKINSFKTKKEYSEQLKSVIDKIDTNSSDNIFKFKLNYSTNFPQCGFSRMRMNKNENEQYFKTSEFKRIIEKLEKNKNKSMKDIYDKIKKENKSKKNKTK